MKGSILFSLIIVGILLFAGTAVGLSFTKYDEATTFVKLDNGIRCTINDVEVGDSHAVTVKTRDGYLDVHVESTDPAVIGYSGKWTSGDRSYVSTDTTDSEVTSYDFKILLDRGKFDGNLAIRNLGAEDGKTLTLTFFIDEHLYVQVNSQDVHDNDKITYSGSEIVVSVLTKDGETHDLFLEGRWGNQSGEDYEVGDEIIGSGTSLKISNNFVYDDGRGYLHFSYLE